MRHQTGPEANLWCDIVWCPTKCSGSGLSKHLLFAHAKVSYLYVSVFVQHHIVQLQISEERQKERKKSNVKPAPPQYILFKVLC